VSEANLLSFATLNSSQLIRNNIYIVPNNIPKYTMRKNVEFNRVDAKKNKNMNMNKDLVFNDQLCTNNFLSEIRTSFPSILAVESEKYLQLQLLTQLANIPEFSYLFA
jgi:hypothetical protein